MNSYVSRSAVVASAQREQSTGYVSVSARAAKATGFVSATVQHLDAGRYAGTDRRSAGHKA